MKEYFFQRSNMLVLELCFEYIALELSQLVVVQVPVLVFVANSEYAE